MQLERKTTDNDNPLIPSFSIQNKDGGYMLLEEPDYTELDEFLSDLDIERKDIPVDSQYLLTLFQHERSAYSWMKWASLDHVLEKLLQWPLLSAHDVGPETKVSVWKRVRPAERSIPLKNTWGLVKVYAVQGFARGLELGLFTSIHVFIYSMLLYRLVKLIQTGSTNVDEFHSSFIGSDQKGIDSLVHLLAGLEERWLKLILTSPVIIGGLQGISNMIGVRRTSAEKLKSYLENIHAHLQKGGSWLRDGIYEYLPGVSSSSRLSLSGQLQKLESLVRWDGRLSSAERRQIFDALYQVTLEGKKTTQLHALQYIAKIAHGIGFKDLPRLKEAGYSTEELKTILYTKSKALEVLTTLSREIKENQLSQLQKIYSLPQRLYCQYLLWWLLGLKTHVFRQQLPALLLKGIKLTIEFYFFQMIILSILEAIRCPDKPGFELGFGYPEWATEFTSDCFIQLIEFQFRTTNLNDSVEQLVAQISLFNLDDLDSLTLSYKNLTGIEMVQILTAIYAQGSILSQLEVWDYFADVDMITLAEYLKTSSIQDVRLGCASTELEGGEGLTNQGLQTLAEVLPMTQVILLAICFPNVGDDGIIALAKILNMTQIEGFYLQSSSIDDEGGEILIQALATMPIKSIMVISSQMGDGAVHALAAILQNNQFLSELWIEGNFITDQGAQYLSQIVRGSFLHTFALASKNVTDRGAVALSSSLQALPSLSYGFVLGSQCGEDGIIALAQQLNQTNFSILELYYNSFTINSMKALAMGFAKSNIVEIFFEGQQFNQDIMAELAIGIESSSVALLAFYSAQLVHSTAVLAPNITKLETLAFYSSQLTDDDIFPLARYLPDSNIQELVFKYNNISDAGVLALVDVLPNTKIVYLNLANNNITDVGAQALANIYSSTRLQGVFLYGNPVSSGLLTQIESFQWQQYCQDQLCHANTQYNGYAATLTSRNPSSMRSRFSYRGQNRFKPNRRYDILESDVKRDTSSKKKTWGTGSFIEVIDHDLNQVTTTDISLTHSPDFHDIGSFSNLTLPELPSSNELPAESLLTPAAAGAMMVGMVGFSLLLYKNVIMVRTVVNTGCQVLQSCFYRTRDSLKAAANFYSFHSPLKTSKTAPQHTDSYPSSFQILG